MLIQDNLSEQLVVGLMLNSNEAVVKGLTLLTEEHFENPSFRMTFQAIKSLKDKNTEINLYSVKGELIVLGNPLSLDDIINIEDKFYFEEKMNSLIEILEDRRSRRESLKKIKDLEKRLKLDNAPYSEIIKDVTAISSDIIQTTDQVVYAKNYREYRESIVKIRQNTEPIKTGFTDLDEQLTYKLAVGELSIIAARPANGKSALKSNIIMNQASSGIGVASYALEQTMAVETDRFDSIRTGIPLIEIAQFEKWAKTDPRWEVLINSWEEQKEWNYIPAIEGTGKSLIQIKHELRSLAESGIKIVFFDLFDRLKEIGGSTANKAQTISSALNHFLEWAKQYKQHYCLLVQLNREMLKRKGDPKPRIDDLKDSGGYEEFARTILLLHYPRAYDRSLINSNLEVQIAKQSNGPLEKFEFYFNPDTLKLSGAEQTSLNFKRMNMKKDDN